MKKLTDWIKEENQESILQCNTCFMTGKACVYQDEVSSSNGALSLKREDREEYYKKYGKAFMLMPFHSTLDEIYRTQIEPCIKFVIGKVSRADDVARTGYVICEKVCKQIQMSDLICAEISCGNPNVYYELGLSYALDRCIALFKQIDVNRGDIVKKMGLEEGVVNEYSPFDMLSVEDIRLWHAPQMRKKEMLRNDKVVIILADSRGYEEMVNGQKFKYSVEGLCRGAINQTLDLCEKDNNDILALRMQCRKTITFKSSGGKGYYEDHNSSPSKKTAISFGEVESYIRNAACVIICTDDSEPMSYFWLGFSHGLEKDVIPITVSMRENCVENVCNDAGTNMFYKKNERDMSGGEPSLPFDIRALWHISFKNSYPSELHDQLGSVLAIVVQRMKDKQYKRRFWQEFTGQEKVSVYVGSVEMKLGGEHKRHVVGEWDYRTVSELISFFSNIKDMMRVIVHAPIYQLGEDRKRSDEFREKYFNELKKQLISGNSVILASTDVNDMTEVALSLFYNVDAFKPEIRRQDNFNGYVAVKSEKSQELIDEKVYPSGFFMYKKTDSADECKDFVRYGREIGVKGNGGCKYDFELYSVFKSHVVKYKIPNTKYWGIIIQGITGPATLGLTLALTGCVNEQFTIINELYDDQQDQDRVDKVDEIIRAVSEESVTLREYLDRLCDVQNISITGVEEIAAAVLAEEKDMENLNNIIKKYKRMGLNYKMYHEHSENISMKLSEKFDSQGRVEAIIRVYVTKESHESHDDRHVIWWDLNKEDNPELFSQTPENSGK